jgi:hypothetical protein
VPNMIGGTLSRLQALRELLHGMAEEEDSDDTLNDEEDFENEDEDLEQSPSQVDNT